MRFIGLFFCFLALLPLVQAQEELPLFPSRDAQVELTDTEGVSLQAVINDVWPERQTARIFVRAQNNSFTLPMDTFSEASQTLIQDWFFKRLASLNLSFNVEERMVGRASTAQNPETLPTASYPDFNIRINDQLREKDLLVEIRNSSNYKQQDLTVTIGLRVVRDITTSSSSSRDRLERTVRSVHRGIDIPSGGSVTLQSPPVILSNYTLRHDRIVQVASPHGGMQDETRRYRAQAVDRIFAYYVLVHYKGELVASIISRQSLVRELMDQKEAELAREQRQTEDVEVFESDFSRTNPTSSIVPTNRFPLSNDSRSARPPIIISN